MPDINVNIALDEPSVAVDLDALRYLVFEGKKGYSPTVTVTDIEGGHRVTITDEDGDHTFDVMDGEGVVSVDSEFSQTSENPVQNKIITGAVAQIERYIDNLSNTKANRTELAPFEIPITQSGSTYTTTATAADILAHKDNCAITLYDGDAKIPLDFYSSTGNATYLLFGTATLVDMPPRIVNYMIQVVGDTVTIQEGDYAIRSLPAATSSDAGKVPTVDSTGGYVLQTPSGGDGVVTVDLADDNSLSYQGNTITIGEIVEMVDDGIDVRLKWDYNGTGLEFVYLYPMFSAGQGGGEFFGYSGAHNRLILAGQQNSSYDILAITEHSLLPSVTASDNGKILGVVNGAWTKTPPANALVIDFNSPYATAYDDAKAAMQGNREVYLSIPNQASNPTECIYLRANAWNATYITFGGLSSAYLPGGYFIMTYAHITSGTSNWFKWTTPFYYNPVLFKHLAPPYDNTATYSVGDYVTYGEDSLNTSSVYRCTTAINTAEDWNSAHWTAVIVMDEVESLIGSVKTDLVVHYDADNSTFDSTFQVIASAVAAGRNVRCEISCGNSEFYAHLSRRFSNTSLPKVISFDYQTYDDNNQMWWGQLTVDEYNTVNYHEGNFAVTEI